MKYIAALVMASVGVLVVVLAAMFVYEFALILFTTTYGRALCGITILAIIYAAIKKETTS